MIEFKWDLVDLFLRITEKFFPAKERPPLEKYNLEELRRKFRVFGWFCIPSGILSMFLFTFLLTVAAYHFQQFFLGTKEAMGIYVVGSSLATLVLPALFLGIFVAGIVFEYILKIIGPRISGSKEEWEVYYYDLNMRHARGREIDRKKLSKILILIFVPLSLLGLFFGIDQYTVVTQEGFLHNGYFDLREKRSYYGDVEKILYIKIEDKHTGIFKPEDSYYKVIMKNGFMWSTLNLDITNTPKEKEIIELISAKAHIPIVEEIKVVGG